MKNVEFLSLIISAARIQHVPSRNRPHRLISVIKSDTGEALFFSSISADADMDMDPHGHVCRSLPHFAAHKMSKLHNNLKVRLLGAEERLIKVRYTPAGLGPAKLSQCCLQT